ncbi:protein melted [Cloeon dipterum]|uniref:protein melted n=1 Tax=Cloeon dipterum TaxID=197152 RepID=UPI00321FE1E2
MHELFTQVLGKKDLSKAGDLFSVLDHAIVNDLTEVIQTINRISTMPDYLNNNNDQSVVEICITRVTSAIRDTGSIEQHAEALVKLLESCLSQNLKPSIKDEDPPHAKISSDIIACLFLNYSKKEVMKRALPVAVKFLHKGNQELSRNMSSYLSLAAIENADLLALHIQPIIDSIISGNYPLARVLPQIYEVNKEPINEHVMALAALLPRCENPDKLALLSLFGLIAKDKPSLLEPCLSQLCEYLGPASTASATMQVFLAMAATRPQLLVDHLQRIKDAAQSHPNTLGLAAQVISSVGKLSKDRAQDALDFVLKSLRHADRGSQGTLLREATLLCTSYPVLINEKMLAQVKHRSDQQNSENQSKVASSQSNTPTTNTISNTGSVTNSSGVTIIKVENGKHAPAEKEPVPNTTTTTTTAFIPNRAVFTGRPRLGDSRSTGRLTSALHTNRSMTKLNGGHGSRMGLHRSVTRLSSSQHINLTPVPQIQHVVPPPLVNKSVTAIHPHPPLPMPRFISNSRISSGGVTVTTTSGTVSPTKSISGSITALREDPYISISTPYSASYNIQPTSPAFIQNGRETVCLYPVITSSGAVQLTQSGTRLHSPFQLSQPAVALTKSHSGTTSLLHQSCASVISTAGLHPGVSSLLPDTKISLPPSLSQTAITSLQTAAPAPAPAPTRRTNTSVTVIGQGMSGIATAQRISVFEPYPFRDTIQHFCEKHLDKIKSYMDKVCVKIPPPAKCTIEERKAKKFAKLHFACQGQGEHCLYSRGFFTMRTRNARIWIHLMFLALQAKSQSALSSRENSLTSLKNCWDILKCETKSFLTLVTSAFPCSKDQDMLLHELRNSGYFDVFEYNVTRQIWGCFLCNHPERASGFLQTTQPVIEGQLKEKKGRWKIFKRWRTRYFTLSGAHLSYRGIDDKDAIPIEVNQIRSVKVSRGARNIPKAFEIFTGDRSLILKPKDGKNAEEWVQCLSIAVAHSHSREVPTKSYSLPARGIGFRTAV